MSRTGVCLPSDLTIRLNAYSVYMHKTRLPTAYEAFMRTGVFRAETEKPIAVFISNLAKLMALNGFIIHNEEQMEMVHHFGHHGVELAGGVNLHMLQVCAPKRAAQSLQENIERAGTAAAAYYRLQPGWTNPGADAVHQRGAGCRTGG